MQVSVSVAKAEQANHHGDYDFFLVHHLFLFFSVTIMDGITMGSAVLFGFNSKFSVATERTLWAVPEVTHTQEFFFLKVFF